MSTEWDSASTTASASATSKRKQKVQWPTNVEQKLIEIWADVLERFGSIVVTKKAKARKAAELLNEYTTTEGTNVQFTPEEVVAKVDNMSAKAKRFCSQFQRPKETGRATDDDDLSIDVEAAAMAWPNFKTFFDVFKTHPTLGSGIADDASEAQPPLEMSHLSEACLQNDISSKASSRPTTPTSAVIDVSSDHDGDERKRRPKTNKNTS